VLLFDRTGPIRQPLPYLSSLTLPPSAAARFAHAHQAMTPPSVLIAL